MIILQSHEWASILKGRIKAINGVACKICLLFSRYCVSSIFLLVALGNGQMLHYKGGLIVEISNLIPNLHLRNRGLFAIKVSVLVLLCVCDIWYDFSLVPFLIAILHVNLDVENKETPFSPPKLWPQFLH